MEYDKITHLLGLDVGSVTVKIAVVEKESLNLVYHDYQRHNSQQSVCVLKLLKAAHKKFKGANFALAICGSGGPQIAKTLNAFFVQEVVANSIAIKHHYNNVGLAIELGGQDAKVIFFNKNDLDGELQVSDMRMNGSCAGGTGAFIDQIATLLAVKTEDFEALAQAGKLVYDISGRCGVFAKTDFRRPDTGNAG